MNKQLLALLLCVSMALALALPAAAEEPGREPGTFVLVAADQTSALSDLTDAGTNISQNSSPWGGGVTRNMGTENFFTVRYSPSSKVDSNNNKVWALGADLDGHKVTSDEVWGGIKGAGEDNVVVPRFNFGGSVRRDWNEQTQEGTKEVINAIQFTTLYSAQVKVWWVDSHDSNARQIGVWSDVDGEPLLKTELASGGQKVHLTVFDLDEAGTFYLGGYQANNWIMKVQVAETAVPAAATYSLVAEDQWDALSDLYTDKSELRAGGKLAGVVRKMGDGEFFTVHYSDNAFVGTTTNCWTAGNVVDGHTLTAEEEYNPKINGQPTPSADRFTFAQPMVRDNEGKYTAAIEFTTHYPATVKLWWQQSSSDADRRVEVWDAAGQLVVGTPNSNISGKRFAILDEIPEGGTYYLGIVGQPGFINKVQVIESAKTAKPVLTDTRAVQDSNYDFTFTVGKTWAADVTYKLYDTDGTTALAAKTVTAGQTELVFDLDRALPSGTYSITAQSGDTPESDGVAVTLSPLRVGPNPITGVSLALSKTTLTPGESLNWRDAVTVTAGDVGTAIDAYDLSVSLTHEAGGALCVNSAKKSYLTAQKPGWSTVTVTATDKEDPGIHFSAEEAVYVVSAGGKVFDAGALALFGGGYKAGDTLAYNDYFTLYLDPDSRVNESIHTWSGAEVSGYTGPAYTGTNHLSPGGFLNAGGKAGLAFTTQLPAKVKLWWAYGGNPGDKTNRQLAIYQDAETLGEAVCTTAVSDDTAHTALLYEEFDLAQAGSYLLGTVGGNNYIYRVEVVEGEPATPPAGGEAYTLTLAVKSAAGVPLEKVPKTGGFWASVGITKNKDGDCGILLAAYGANRQFLGLLHADVRDLSVGEHFTLDFYLANPDNAITEIKAFALASLGSLTPLGEAKSLTQ